MVLLAYVIKSELLSPYIQDLPQRASVLPAQTSVLSLQIHPHLVPRMSAERWLISL